MDENTTPDGSGGPRVTRDQVKDLGRLRRSVTDRHIAGVAGGLARHLDIDPLIVRVVLVLSIFLGGSGLIVYVAVWVLVPEEYTDDRPLGVDERTRTVLLLVAGAVAVLAAVGDQAGAFWFPWPIVVVVLLVLWFVNRNSSTSALAPARSPAFAPYGGEMSPPTGPLDYARPRGPDDRRRRGPLLFGPTMALISLAVLGVLTILDIAGVPIAPSAYPALALGITAVMLIIGAFWGRPNGLILLGLVLTLATAGTFAFTHWPERDVVHTPTSASSVQELYEMRAGDLTLDLSEVGDPADLDARVLRVDGFTGRITVILPEDVTVDIDANVAIGSIEAPGRTADGIDNAVSTVRSAGSGAPRLDLDVELAVGEIVISEK